MLLPLIWPLIDVGNKKRKLGRAPPRYHCDKISMNSDQQFWRKRFLKIYANFPSSGPFLAPNEYAAPSNTHILVLLQ